MGRRGVGETSGAGVSRGEAGRGPGWRKDDPRSQGALRAFLEGGERTRFQRTHPLPLPGDRYGSLTVVSTVGSGDSLRIRVVCDCWRPAYTVLFSNLVNGRTKRCNVCAKRQTASVLRSYRGYDQIIPNDSVRERLLSRLSAAIRRCHNSRDSNYVNYGLRGISVHDGWRNDRAEFLRHVVTLPGWDDPALEMDRADVNRGYEPGNIRFVSRRVNAANRRRIPDLEQRIRDLERRLRHCTCGSAEQVHDHD